MTDAGRRPARALRHPGFRLLWVGQWVRTTALWMQLVATPLLALSIGASPFELGVIHSLQFLPILFLAPFGGVLADRIQKRRALMVLQMLHAAQSLAFVAVVLIGGVTLWEIWLLSAALGLINAVDMPMRTSFVGEVVPHDDIPNAVALMMVAFNGSRIIGPAAAGILAATVGFQANFMWSAVAALVTFTLLAMIRSSAAPAASAEGSASVGRSLANGVHFVRDDPRVFTALATIAIVNLLGASFQSIAPVFALDTLGLNESGFGLLLAAMGAGALATSLVVTLISLPVAERLLVVGPIGLAVMLAALALTSNAPAAFLLIPILGVFVLLSTSATHVTVQGSVPHEVRGRVMGLYIAVMHGSTAVGAVLMGALTEAWDAPRAMLTAAAAIGLATLVVRLRRGRVRETRAETGALERSVG